MRGTPSYQTKKIPLNALSLLLALVFLVGCGGSKQEPDPIAIEPELLLVVEAHQSRITLNWTDEAAVSNGYILERRVGNAAFSELAKLDSVTRTYNDYDVGTGNIYTYRLTSQAERGQTLSNLAGETVAVPVHFNESTHIFSLPGSVITVGGRTFTDTAFLPPNRMAMVEVGNVPYLVNPSMGISELTLRNSIRHLSLDGFTPPSLDQSAVTLSTGVDLRQVGPSTGASATYRFTNRKHRWVAVEVIEPGGAQKVHYLQANGSLLSIGLHELIGGAENTAPGAPASQDIEIPARSTVRVYGSFARGGLGYYLPYLRDSSFREARNQIQRTNELLYVKLNTVDLIDFLWQPLAGVLLDSVGLDDVTLETLSKCFVDFAGGPGTTFLEDTVNSVGGGQRVIRAAQQSVAELNDGMKLKLVACASSLFDRDLAELVGNVIGIVGTLTVIGDFFVANADVASVALFNEFQMPQLRVSHDPPDELGAETLLHADSSSLFDFDIHSIEWRLPGERDSAPGNALLTKAHSFGNNAGPLVTLAMALTTSSGDFTSGQLRLNTTTHLDLSLGDPGLPYADVSGQWVGPLTDMTTQASPVRLSLNSHAPINGEIGQLVYNKRYCFVALIRQPEVEGELRMAQEHRGGTGSCLPGEVIINRHSNEALHVELQNDSGSVEWSGVLTRLEAHSIPTAITAGHLPSRLYNVGLSEYGYDELLGPVVTTSGQAIQLFDLAYCPDGALYGVTSTTLYEINPADLVATSIRNIGGNSNALVCSATGELYVGINNRLLELDRTTGHGIEIGRLGVSGNFSGDLVFGNQGRLYATLTGSPNRLAIISLHTGQASVIGPIPISSAIHGLSYSNGILYGLSNERQYGYLFEIDPQTADSTFLRYMWFPAYGSNRVD